MNVPVCYIFGFAMVGFMFCFFLSSGFCLFPIVLEHLTIGGSGFGRSSKILYDGLHVAFEFVICDGFLVFVWYHLDDKGFGISPVYLNNGFVHFLVSFRYEFCHVGYLVFVEIQGFGHFLDVWPA